MALVLCIAMIGSSALVLLADGIVKIWEIIQEKQNAE